MLPRILLDTALIPNTDKEMQLYQSGNLFSIKIPGRGDLMNSHMHGSEKALADRAFSKRLRQAGFDVREHVVRPRRAGKGPRHPIWVGA